jgi:chemotaxis methyl-accepting protein methylase
MSMDRGFAAELSALRDRHFTPQGSAYRIAQEVQDLCHFEVHNLLDDSSAFGSFDVILLRNVLTYLSDRARREVLTRVERRLAVGGILVPGAAESWKDLRPSLREEIVAGGVRIYRRGVA